MCQCYAIINPKLGSYEAMKFQYSLVDVLFVPCTKLKSPGPSVAIRLMGVKRKSLVNAEDVFF